MKSLKSIHDNKLLTETMAKAGFARKLNEGKLLMENNEIRMLMEAVDEAKLSEFVNILNKLDSLAGSVEGLEIIKMAVEAARNDLQKSLQGGIKQKAKEIWAKPTTKCMGLLSTLKTAFQVIPKLTTLVKSNKPEDQDKTLDELLKDSPGKSKQGQDLFRKAFIPQGFWASVKSLFGGAQSVPYIDNNSLNVLVRDIFEKVKYQDLLKFTGSMNGVKIPISAEDAKAITQPTDAKAAEAAPKADANASPEVKAQNIIKALKANGIDVPNEKQNDLLKAILPFLSAQEQPAAAETTKTRIAPEEAPKVRIGQ